MSEQIVKDCLNEKYGDFIPIRLAGGYTNETFLLQGTDPLVIAKLSRSLNGDVENEKNALLLLRDTGIAPRFFDFIKTSEYLITVMEFRAGRNGQSILDHNELEMTKELYKSLGAALARDIHSIKYSDSAKGIRECNVYEVNYDLDFVPEPLREKSKETIKALQDEKKDWVLTHGDYGIHNVLYSDAKELIVIDWEWAEWANPLTDIAWVCWFTRLHYPNYANVLNSLFTNEYSRNGIAFLSPEKLQSYCIYKVWKVLYKVKNAPQEVQEEWVRRLQWTFETDIFDFFN
ncbi:aminoglycoside phosphotransferase family protein [Neobacillus sp. D3-1R]|uniref:aminoglycoside phosphotransferase family protein n=1 Tax=Neobacillus sp. D3-1R TaxID=3445778 RepID=UPI003FA07FCF